MRNPVMHMSEMNSDRWRLLRSLLDEALELDAEARARFVAALAPGDDGIRHEIERLLAEHEHLAVRALPSAMELAAPAVAASMQEDADFERTRIGQVIGAYRLVGLLGTGGMGAVYLAERSTEAFAQTVALKVVRKVIGSAKERERFERERQILASLRHPGIALLFDGGQTPEGQSFYTMEYVDGASITDFCREHASSVESRIRLLLQVATTLAYAHQKLIVHRDIKPPNVLVTREGRVKLVDFGLAKLLDEHALPSMTQIGIGPMTPAYASPEQFHNSATAVATDVYQFGVLCFRILTGRLPYRADPDDNLEWARAVTEEEPITLLHAFDLEEATKDASERVASSKFRRQLTKDLDAIVRKALAKSPDARYRSMDAMIADLEAFLDHRPVTARRAGPLYFGWRFVQRHRIGVATAVLAFVALGATTLIAVRQSSVAMGEAQRANREANRANAVADFLIDLFKVSDPAVNRGERLNANQILERGTRRLNSQLATQPDQQARFLSVIGEVYLSLGDLERAFSALDRAVHLFRSDQTSDRYAFAKALRLLARATNGRGEMGAATLLMDEEERLLLDASPRTSEERVRMHLLRADIQRNRGDLLGQLAEADIALDLFDRTGLSDRPLHATLQIYRAKAQRDAGKWNDARESFKKAYQTALDVYEEGDFERTAAAEAYGEVLLRTGDLAGAQNLLEPVEPRVRTQFGEESNQYGAIMATLAELARRQSNLALALQRLAASEKAYRSTYGNHHPASSWVIVSTAEIMIEQGEYTKALARMEESLALRRSVLPEDHPEIAHSYYGIAEALIPLRRYEEAKDDTQKALAIIRPKLPPDNALVVLCLTQLGLIDYALGDKVAAKLAWDEALDRAARAYPLQSAEFDKVRQTIENPAAALRPRKAT